MVIKCKMCGGDLIIRGASRVCECDYCGSQQTVPLADDEKKINMYNRANRLRMNADFDQAAVVYTSITAEYPQEAEAYWGLCLCKYGIEYVDDPLTKRKFPTCHRTLLTSVLNDNDFIQACQNAANDARDMYLKEADAINQLQQRIIEIVKTEKPYDVFISYKETDEAGRPTRESFVAEKLYNQLTQSGFRTFFAKVSLRNIVGKEYEPYIFAAIYSAKVMIVLGSKKEYFESAWVKNEWSRYLELLRKDSARVLIPCYRAMQVKDLPEALKPLQSLDMDRSDYYQSVMQSVEKTVRPVNKTGNLEYYSDAEPVNASQRFAKNPERDINQAADFPLMDVNNKPSSRKSRSFLINVSIVIAALIVGFFLVKANPKSQSYYFGMDIEEAKNELSSAGFQNINLMPDEDLYANEKSLKDKVKQVTINNSENLSGRISFKWETVNIYYHKMPDNPPVVAPLDSGSECGALSLQDAINYFQHLGFAQVNTEPVYELDDYKSVLREMVDYITIAGEINWKENNIRKTYHQSDEVMIYYFEAKLDAKVEPPEGNSSHLIGEDYEYVESLFKERGFSEIVTVGNCAVTKADRDLNKVIDVMVAGENNWSYGIGGMLRKSYPRNSRVAIYYNSAKDEEDATSSE